MNKKFYITAAIPYVNAKPHIGHVLEYVQVDVVKRYHRLLGEDSVSLSGGDENALKNVQAAEKADQPIQQFVDENTESFRQMAIKINGEFTYWQKGSDQKTHFPSSQDLWNLCKKDIYKKSYTGLYCVGCETFYTPDELNEKGECFEHQGKKLDEVHEENYFFKLSAYQEKLIKLIETDELKIIPDFRKNETLSFLKSGLQDISISRSNERAKNWGVPVPNDPKQRIYVWFDALNIYRSGAPEKYWPADVHAIGKGISRFHCVYWPAFLLSAGLPLPKTIFIHGYLTVNGQKISKSNPASVIDPVPLIEKYGADALRYFLLAKISPFNDGDFSEEKLIEVYNADLANGLGNLVSRVAKLAESANVAIDNIEKPKEIYRPIQEKTLSEFRFDEVLSNIWTTDISPINKHIDQNQPWLIKDQEKLKEVLLEEIKDIRIVAYKLLPFIPASAEKILKQFSGQIRSGDPLFPRIK
ncbi:MAG: methionine--tRNA ligase [bacterium]|nr:methionine--tRNA ligase [bacterium]